MAPSSIIRRGRPISITPAILFTKLLRSFSTSSTPNDFDNLFSSNATSANSSSTAPPPQPIPNRPLRADNPFNKRRPPIRQPPQPQNPQFKKSLQNEPSGAEFLERFKLDFENGPSSDKRSTEKDKNVPIAETAEPAPQEDADEIFKKMKETGLIPNAVAMLDGLCKDGLVQEAMKLFGLMREKGTFPEVVIYTAVVEGFCKAQKFDDAIRIFRKMHGNNIVPNAFSYGLLVQGLCKGKRFEDALQFCVEMLEAGHSPNLATFIGLIDGFCREKGLEDAKNTITTLKQRGYFYDEKTAREYLDKKGPFLPVVWEAVVGKKASQKSSLFD